MSGERTTKFGNRSVLADAYLLTTRTANIFFASMWIYIESLLSHAGPCRKLYARSLVRADLQKQYERWNKSV
jgi:hypothetical protein